MQSTKGPWRIGEMEEGAHIQIIGNDDEERIVARVPYKRRFDEMLANAEIISYAPELIEALKPFAAMPLRTEVMGVYGDPELDEYILAARGLLLKLGIDVASLILA